MNYNKLKFLLTRPRPVLILGSGKRTAKEAVLKVLEGHFKAGKEVFVSDQNDEETQFLMKRSKTPLVIATHLGEYHPDKEFFSGELEAADDLLRLASAISPQANLILNFDDETVRDMKNKTKAHPVTFGFGMRADVRATDIVSTQFPGLGTNFKINHEGNIVPCWLANLFGKENIYAALAAAALGLTMGLNLVEISEGLKGYSGVAGRLRLIKGIKKSMILDDSENASPLSMSESLNTLKKIEGVSRKIAVLGDIIGVGKYAIEAHEAVGGEIKGSCDLLFTVGERAKFFAQGAAMNGLAEEKIFRFDDAASAAKALQNELKEGDLVLVDGSKEMSMIEVVKEIEAGPIV